MARSTRRSISRSCTTSRAARSFYPSLSSSQLRVTLDRKLRVVIDWTFKLFFPPDLNYFDLRKTQLNEPVKAIGSRRIVTVAPGQSIREALGVLYREEVKQAPVVEADGQPSRPPRLRGRSGRQSADGGQLRGLTAAAPRRCA